MKYYFTAVIALMLVACGSTVNPTTPPKTLAMVLIDASPDDISRGTFSTALRQDSLADVRKLFIELDSPYTVFVPSNAAFEAYFKARGITEETFMKSSELPGFIRAHIAPGNYYAKTLFETENLSFNNLDGNPLTITRQKEDFYVNDVLIYGPVLEDEKKQNDGAIYYLSGVIEP